MNSSFRCRVNKNWLLWLGLALVLFGYVSLFREALIDDAFITLNYVKTLTTSGVWGFYPIHVTNTATSPLNVLLEAFVTLFTRSPLESVFWLTVVEWLALAFFLRRIGKILALDWFPYIAFSALVFNPLLISTLGLESTLYTTLLVAALYFLLAKQWTLLALTMALLTMARPDGFLFFVISLAFLPTWQRRLRVFGFYIVGIAPWYLYAWIALGSILPDTLLIKVRQSWGNISFGDGLPLYARRYPLPIALSFFLTPLAGLTLLKPVRQLGAIVWILLLYGVLHFAAYAILRVPPYHWYYVSEIVCGVLLAALGLSKLRVAVQGNWKRGLVAAASWLALLTPIGGTVALFGLASVPLQESFIHTNWATHDQYREVGLFLKQNYAGKTVPGNGEPGTIAYYCDCYELDYLFTVRDWVAKDVTRYRTESSLSDLLLRFNYLFFVKSAPYPPPAAHLQVFTKATTPPAPPQSSWETHTQWVKAGLIVLSAK